MVLLLGAATSREKLTQITGVPSRSLPEGKMRRQGVLSGSLVLMILPGTSTGAAPQCLSLQQLWRLTRGQWHRWSEAVGQSYFHLLELVRVKDGSRRNWYGISFLPLITTATMIVLWTSLLV